MIPLSDANPTRRTPVITILLIATCTVLWFGVQQRGDVETQDRFVLERAAIPCEVVTGTPETADELQSGDCTRRDETAPMFPGKGVWFAVVTSMFLHGGFLHLAGNMLYLWVFGNNIEDRAGRVVYLLFYLAAGVVATATHIALQPESTVPVVGASGAIAGVMGAYLVLYPRVRIRSLIIFFLILFRDIEARWLLLFWFASQFILNRSSGVAWGAHVGGFAFGVLAGLVWRARGPSERGVRPLAQPPYA